MLADFPRIGDRPLTLEQLLNAAPYAFPLRDRVEVSARIRSLSFDPVSRLRSVLVFEPAKWIYHFDAMENINNAARVHYLVQALLRNAYCLPLKVEVDDSAMRIENSLSDKTKRASTIRLQSRISSSYFFLQCSVQRTGNQKVSRLDHPATIRCEEVIEEQVNQEKDRRHQRKNRLLAAKKERGSGASPQISCARKFHIKVPVLGEIRCDVMLRSGFARLGTFTPWIGSI